MDRGQHHDGRRCKNHISPKKAKQQMILLHNIGERVNSNYNTLSEILACRDRLSFDGVYENVWKHRYDLKDLKPIFFVMGNYVGKDNSFEPEMPREKYCDWHQVFDLVKLSNGHFGWHTWSHRDLTQLSDEEVIKEITPPFQMRYFAYPFGRCDARVAKLVEAAKFDRAYSVDQGDGSRFQLKRKYLNW